MKENYSHEKLYDIGEHFKFLLTDVAIATHHYGLPGVLGLIAKVIEFGHGHDEAILAMCHMLHFWDIESDGQDFSPEFILRLIELYEGNDPGVHLWNRDEDGRLFLIHEYLV
jgi:hypothetical protein